MKRYSSTMRESYRRNSSKKSKKWLYISGLVILTGLSLPWLVTTVSAVVMYPFHATTTWLKTSEGVFPTYWRSRDELANEVEDLRSRLATGSGTQQSINRLVEENMQLRAMLKAGSGDDRMVARVLSRPDRLPYDLLQLDKGTRDGVVVGAPVYSGLDSVIGVVVSATERYSFVDLFTSPGFISTAYIFGPDVFAQLEGMGGGVARVKLPQGVAIRLGQMVILPGISTGIYGEIVSIENEPTQPEQYGYIAPLVSMNSLLYVAVGSNPVTEPTPEMINDSIRNSVRDSFAISSTTLGELASSTPETGDDSLLEGATTSGERNN
jgi:cell shape-determining protein MreC